VMQVTSMSLGAGVFAIPYAFLELGFVHGAFWVLVMGFFADTALQLLLDVAATHSLTSYEDIAERAFGRAGKVGMAVLTLVTTWIATLSYLSASRDLLVGVVVAFFIDFDINSVPDGVVVLSKPKAVAFLAILLAAVLPLCLSRSMGGNAWISKLGVITISSASVFFVGSCVAALLGSCPCGGQPPAIGSSAASAFQYTGTLAFSFSMVFAVFPVLSERVGEDGVAAAVVRLKPAVRASVALCVVIYLLVGLMGVITYGSLTQPVALANPSLDNPLTQFVNLAVGISTLLLVAIISFPVLASLELLGGWDTDESSARPWLVFGLGITSILIDSVLPTKVAFALTGSLGLANGAYTVPCLLFLRMGASRDKCKRAAAVLVLVFGCALMLGSTPVTVFRLLSQGDAQKGESLTDLICHHSSEGGGLFAYAEGDLELTST